MVGERSPQGLEGQIAFLGVTNEKQHVRTSTQAFQSTKLEFMRRLCEDRRDAALAFAAADRVATPALVPPSALNSAASRADATFSARSAAATAATAAAVAAAAA